MTSATFISYSHGDSTFAFRLAEDLRAAGVNVWIDNKDISSGKHWDLTIEKALVDCTSMLAILSPASVTSNNVLDEVSFALDHNKTVIPIIYKGCDVPYRLRRLQYLDFTQNYRSGFDELLEALAPERKTDQSTAASPDFHWQPLTDIQETVKCPAESEDFWTDQTCRASANVLSGNLDLPIEQVISPRGLVRLPIRGGFYRTEISDFKIPSLISLTSAHTHVAGNDNADSWTTTANATIEKLNVFDVVTVDRIVVQISIDIPKDEKSVPAINFFGTRFENLSLNGKAVEVELETRILHHRRITPRTASSDNSTPDSHGDGTLYSSLVRRVDPSRSLEISGNVITLPGFGKIFLTELTRHEDSYQFRMIRLAASAGVMRVATCQASARPPDPEVKN